MSSGIAFTSIIPPCEDVAMFRPRDCKTLFRTLVLSLALGSLLMTASPRVQAAGITSEVTEPSYGTMVVDGLLVRPLGLVATVFGVAAWVVTLPFSALGGNVGEATEDLIVEPARFTFVRPLGDL
jgi:hypothetical protein